MKKIFMAMLIGWLGYACTEDKVWVYSLDRDYVYLSYDNTKLSANQADSVYVYYNMSSLRVNSVQQRDTFYFRVLVAGMAKDYDRKLKIEPYTFDMQNVEIGIENVNYVAFDEPEMEKHLVVPADSIGVDIPIIVKYDPTIAGSYKNFIVGFRLADTEDFSVLATNANLQANPARSHAYVRFTQSN